MRPLLLQGVHFWYFKRGGPAARSAAVRPTPKVAHEGAARSIPAARESNKGPLHFAAVSYFAMGIVIPGGPEQKISVDESCLLREEEGSS